MPEQSPFDALESTFRLLCKGPSPLAVHGRELGPPFPSRPIPLTELGVMLLHPATPYPARDRAIRLLLGRAADHGGRWTIALAGVLLPGLRAGLASMAKAWPGGAADLEADALVALIEAIPVFDPSAEPVAARLVWRVTSAARRRLAREMAVTGRQVPGACPAEPHQPWGHPDFVLGEAVRAGVVSVAEAELIGETRLGSTSLHAYAQAKGAGDGTLRMRRMRAERRLVSWVWGRNV
ncbi:MAG: hypothetical protein CYG61_10245 [Actinobacteria bacterium]|nr:MAG: hypothetical protein CYG61_10245 [Actinomycetota bacterium]